MSKSRSRLGFVHRIQLLRCRELEMLLLRVWTSLVLANHLFEFLHNVLRDLVPQQASDEYISLASQRVFPLELQQRLGEIA